MDIFTIQLAQAWRARPWKIHVIDISPGNGHPAFYLPWELFTDLRNGTIDFPTFEYKYRLEVQARYRANPMIFAPLVKSPDPIAFAAFPPYGQPCHRHMAARLLKELCDRHQVEARLYGEFQ